MAINSNEQEGLNKYAIIETCEEFSLSKSSVEKNSLEKKSVRKGSLDREFTKIPSINEEENSEVELAEEADGYLSDVSTTSSESGNF